MLRDDSVAACSDRSLRRKWEGIRYLYNIVNKQPYRYHSMACALEATPGAGYRVNQTAFVSRMMAEYNFDRKMRMDTQLRSLYECFEGAREGAVDYRDVLCCMTVLRRYKEVRENPRRLLRDLVFEYSDEAGGKVRRQDALRVMRMGAIDGVDVLKTSARLNAYLVAEAGSRGLKPTFRDLGVALLMEVIESNPSVLVAFRTQLWQRLPEAWRLGMLQAVEAMRFDKAGSGALAAKQRRAARWHAKTLSRRIMVGWKIFRNRAKQMKARREIIEILLRRSALQAWHISASKSVGRRERLAIADQRGRLFALRRSFKRVVDFAKSRKKLAAMTGAFSKRGKLVVAGVGHLREALRKRSMRLFLRAWCEVASLMNAWEFAADLSEERLCRRTFFGFREIVRVTVTARRTDDEAEMRAGEIAEAVEEAERQNVQLIVAAEVEAKRVKALAKANLMAERAVAYKTSLEAARAGSIVRDADVMARQREARRRRVYEDRVRVQTDFEAEWEIKFREMVEREMEASEKWLETDREAPFKVQKEMTILKRKFYAAPAPETAELERALRDPANAIFAHMAHLLYDNNMTLRAFFQQHDKEGDGYLTHEEFKGMVSSLNIKLSGEQIRSVIRAIDLDGGGFVDFPEFEAAVKRHEDVCGAAGARWKMYVSPKHAIMIFHNVETNEEIWDYKATDKDLLRVVKDNHVGLEGITAKARVAKEREQAWEKLLRDRAATVLQKQYHAWAARKKRGLLRWKWDVEKARETNRIDNTTTTVIQSWWRVLRAKWLALRLLDITVEVLWDPGSNQRYYFNHPLGCATWEIPSMLRRWRGRDARMPDVPEWVLISRIFGQSYFYNTQSRSRQDDKPAGYPRCLSCHTQLATRRCIVEQRDLCFVCYRQEHLQGDEACWHRWKPSTAHTCRMCGQRDATVVCSQCNASDGTEGPQEGLPLCESCWDRTHAHASAKDHARVAVEQWAALDAGDGVVFERGVLEDSGRALLTGGGGWDKGIMSVVEEKRLDEGVPLVEAHVWEGGLSVGNVGDYTGAEQFGHDAD